MCDPRLVRPLLHSGRGYATSPSPLKVPWQTVHALASSLFLHFKRLGAILCTRVAGCHMSFWTSANAFVESQSASWAHAIQMHTSARAAAAVLLARISIVSRSRASHVLKSGRSERWRLLYPRQVSGGVWILHERINVNAALHFPRCRDAPRACRLSARLCSLRLRIHPGCSGWVWGR